MRNLQQPAIDFLPCKQGRIHALRHTILTYRHTIPSDRHTIPSDRHTILADR